MLQRVGWRAVLVCLFAIHLGTRPGQAQESRETRPLLVTVDDLPIGSGRFHRQPAERERILGGLLAVLEKHGIQAVGLVTWQNVSAPGDLELLEMWLEAGHEIGNHSRSHLSYTTVDIATYIRDVEFARERISDFLAARGKPLRFFRFPFLREGDSTGKLEAMRDYLRESGQRNLPVTIDNQDWSFEERWVEARRAGDAAALEKIAAEYQSALRLEVVYHERHGDELFGRPVPQVLLLHANEVGTTQWDGLFTWLESTGHRFAPADEVLADPAFAEPHEYVGSHGPGLWDRLLDARRQKRVRQEIRALLETQAADWNRGDVETFCSVYAGDAAFVSPSGLTRGRQAVLERYRRRYPDRAAMGNLSLDVIEVRPASGTEVSMLGDARPSRVHSVSVVARWTLSYPDKEPATGLTLLVFRRRASGGWEIVQDASM
ncbi:MAG: SgcJ/EcaC family oxidoreductase [Candidatus Krumholzibacteriia bacterium]